MSVKSLLLAVQFLTIIPVHVKGEVTEADVARSAAFFPLAGAVQGLIGAIAALIAVRLFPDAVAGGLVLLVLTAVNGGFHLDALADTFDAIAVKSTGNVEQDRQKRLSVMKDSATGAIGVVAIVMGLLLKYLFISSLFAKYGTWSAAYLLFLMAVFSKWAMTPAIFHGQAAGSGGLGRIFIEGSGRTDISLVVAHARRRDTGGNMALAIVHPWPPGCTFCPFPASACTPSACSGSLFATGNSAASQGIPSGRRPR